MKKQDFYRYIKSHIGQYIPDLESVEIEPVRKNNGTFLDGFMGKQAGSNVSPVIYLEQYYEKVAKGEFTMDEAVAEIANTYKSHCTTEYNDIGKSFVNFDFVRDKIIMKCLNIERNEELLQQVPHTEKEDLAFVYNVCLDANRDGQANILIRNEHMKWWDVTAEEIHELAVENSKRILPVTVRSMNNVIKAEFGEDPFMSEPYFDMYVVSNRYYTNGAAAIFYSNILAEIAEAEQRDVIVLPSSIHEVLVIPYDEGMNMEALAQMVQTVNREEVLKEEILSDHVYKYQAKSREFKLADVTLEQLKMERQKRKEEAQRQEPEKSVIISFPRI